jgi:hypothetical protein
VKERKNNVSRAVQKPERHRSGRLLAGTMAQCGKRCDHTLVHIDFKRLEEYLTHRRSAVMLAEFLLSA